MTTTHKERTQEIAPFLFVIPSEGKENHQQTTQEKPTKNRSKAITTRQATTKATARDENIGAKPTKIGAFSLFSP